MGKMYGSRHANSRKIVTQVQFETGDEKLKVLELKVFVASGRFVVEGGKTIVEYKISEVAIGEA